MKQFIDWLLAQRGGLSECYDDSEGRAVALRCFRQGIAFRLVP